MKKRSVFKDIVETLVILSIMGVVVAMVSWLFGFSPWAGFAGPFVVSVGAWFLDWLDKGRQAMELVDELQNRVWRLEHQIQASAHHGDKIIMLDARVEEMERTKLHAQLNGRG